MARGIDLVGPQCGASRIERAIEIGGEKCAGFLSGELICFEHGAVMIRIRFRQKMQTDEAKAIYKTRSQVAEFPNLWIKTKFGLRQFTCGRRQGTHRI